jgi:hypothetical protein
MTRYTANSSYLTKDPYLCDWDNLTDYTGMCLSGLLVTLKIYVYSFKILYIILMTAHKVSDCIALQIYSELSPLLGSVHHPPSKYFIFMMWGCCLPFGWTLNAGFQVLWMLGRIASLAKPSNFQDGVPFIPFLRWFHDIKSCRPKLTQLLQLVQIMTFSIAVSSLVLVNSKAMFPADSSVLEITASPRHSVPSFCVVWCGPRTLRHTNYFC